MRYKEHYILFEKFQYSGHEIKLDVWFETDGAAYTVLWIPAAGGTTGRNVLTSLLISAGLLREFVEEPRFNENGFRKGFCIGKEFETMQEVDLALLAFIKKLLTSFQNISQSPSQN